MAAATLRTALSDCARTPLDRRDDVRPLQTPSQNPSSKGAFRSSLMVSRIGLHGHVPSKSCGPSLRLPSEAEWEYVARAGTATARMGNARTRTGPMRVGAPDHPGTLEGSHAGTATLPRLRWACSRRTPSDYMMFWETYGSGWRTVGMTTTLERRQTGAHGPRAATVLAVCRVAATGEATRRTSVRRAASGSRPIELSPGRVARILN